MIADAGLLIIFLGSLCIYKFYLGYKKDDEKRVGTACLCFLFLSLMLLGGCGIYEDAAKPVELEADNTKLRPRQIIWIGDSLTQGSFGEDNHNENNPYAPYKVLAEMTDIPVKGYGYYGYNAHDCLWKFGEDGGEKDSQNLYIFWVGSNDWAANPNDVKTVTEEINNFVNNNGINDYFVIGTTNRPELILNDAYVKINEALKSEYQNRYIDIIPYVDYSADMIHLNEQSYANIAKVVYEAIYSSLNK